VLTPQSAPFTEDAKTGTIERRAWVRFPCHLESSCQPLAGQRGMQWQAKVRNISRGGTALTMGRRFEVGTFLTIEIQGMHGESLATLMAKVAHVTAQPGGMWLLGCSFTQELAEADLQSLL
jgi:hypothetical protein